MNTRILLVMIVMTLCVLDLCLTYYYVYNYKKWQPDKPYKLIELNPLLRLSWEKFGLHLGMFIAVVVILALNYIISKEAHWIIVAILIGFLIFAMLNHARNITLLTKLISEYPSGHLPIAIFGKVIGNN